MIVKELRQGLRTWVFVGAFIALQAILVMTLLISSSAGNAEASNMLFWMLIAGILVFVVPLRGFNALAGEMKSETLDLLMLTRLGAFRIALGKWIALAAQSGLIAISVLPYVVLRYFGGGVDVLAELRALVLLWMLSAAVTAIAVAFSALPSIIIRTLVLLATWFWAMMACGFVVAATIEEQNIDMFGFGGATTHDWWFFLTLLTALWAYGCYFVLDIGASAIAPPASNHATRKRLISLALMLTAFGFVLFWPDPQGRDLATGCLCAVAAVCAFDCLTETPTVSPSVYAPFVRRGWLGRRAAYFLAPGWPTGVAFYFVMAAMVAAALFRDTVHTAYDGLVLANALLSPLTPLALALLCFRHTNRLLGPYLACAIVLAISSALLLFMMNVGNADNVAFVGVLTPPSALTLALDLSDNTSEKQVLAGGVISGSCILLFLLIKAATHFKALHRVMRQAATAL